MPDHTKSSHVVLWASWLAPCRSATLHFLVGASHSRPHPASQGRRWGRRSAVTAGSKQLISINNKRQKYNRKILNPFCSFNRKASKKIKYKKRPQKYQCSPPHSPHKKKQKDSRHKHSPNAQSHHLCGFCFWFFYLPSLERCL